MADEEHARREAGEYVTDNYGLMATGAAEVEGQEIRPTTSKLTLLPLMALAIGSMIGGRVFNLPSDMSRAAAPLSYL